MEKMLVFTTKIDIMLKEEVLHFVKGTNEERIRRQAHNRFERYHPGID